MGQGGGALFLLAKMGQNSIDDVLVLDTCNDSRRSAAPTANLDIDVEYAFKPLRPGPSSMALGRCLYFRICAHLRFLAMFGRGDLPAPAVVRCQNAVVAGEIDTRFWY